MNYDHAAQKEKEHPDPAPIEIGGWEDKKRAFLELQRPHLKKWNFIEDANVTPHVLRANADSRQCYEDGRMQQVLKVIQGLGEHIRTHNKENWGPLNDLTTAIFETEEKAIAKSYEEYC